MQSLSKDSLSAQLAIAERIEFICDYIRTERSDGWYDDRAQYGKSLAGNRKIGKVVRIPKTHKITEN